jgi:hypothetical protein
MASGAILFRFTLKAAPTLGGSGPFTTQTFGLSTGDTDLVGIDIVGDTVACKFWSGYASKLTYSNGLDLSQGKGGFASATEADLTVIDATADTGISLSAAIRSGLVVLEGASVWAAAIPYGGTFADVKKIIQLQIAGDPSIAGGNNPSVRLHLRSASWVAASVLSTTVNRPQILTDQNDSQNPTDPLYPDGPGSNQVFQTAIGNVFGGIPVSIKAGDAQPAQRLARFGNSLLVRGEMSVDPTTLGYGKSVSLTGDTIGRVDRPSAYGTTILFKCEKATRENWPPDYTEANRLIALMDEFVANGYEIVLSNGKWFLAGDSFDRFNGFSTVDSSFATVQTLGNFYGVGYTTDAFTDNAWSGVWFNLSDSDQMTMFPADLDPTSVSIYAIPKNFLACNDQVIIDGVVSGNATLPVNAELVAYNGIYTTFSPRQTSADSVIVSAPVLSSAGPENLISVDPTGATTGSGCAIGDGRIYGDTANISTDGSEWNGLDSSTLLARVGLEMNAPAERKLRVNFKIQAIDFDADFFCSECQYSMKATSDLLSVVNVKFSFQPPFFKEIDQYRVLSALSPALEVDRTKDQTALNWRSYFESIEDINKDSFLELINMSISQPDFLGIQIKMKKIVLRGFKKIGFSSLYLVVYPFPLRYGFEQIAASPTVVCGLVGLGAIDIGSISGQNIAWRSVSPVVASDSGAPSWVGIAYDGAGRFVAIGRLTGADTADDRMIFATSTDNGATWTTSKDATFPGWGFSKIYCDGVRWVILVSGDNSIRTQTVAGYPGTWTDTTTSRQFACAKGNGSLWLVGGAVASGYNLATTTNFASLATQTVGTTEEVRSISWLPGTKTWLVGMTDGSVWYCTVATDATVPTTWTKVVVFAGGLGVLGNWSGLSLEAFGFDLDGRVRQKGTLDGVNWVDRESRPDVAIYNAVYTNPSGAGIWIGASGSNQEGQIVTANGSARNWTPWATPSPSSALQKLRSKYFNGIGLYDYNPLRWSGFAYLGEGAGTNFGIAFDPANDENPSTAVAKICEEWWGIAGEFAGDVDASNDPIEEALPVIDPGDVEDVYSELTFEYHKFGDAYLKTAYVRNTDVAYVSGNDSFYFGGWDPPGTNTKGLEIWNECRASYLRYGTKRPLKRTFDSIHDESTMGNVWTYVDPDLGKRLHWITRQPRYFSLKIKGVFGSTQDVASLRAMSGCRYKANQTMVAAQGWSIPEWGIVTNVEADVIPGEFDLEIAFAPE